MSTYQNRLPESCFSTLITHSTLALNISFQTVKDKYRDYSLCLKECLSTDACKKTIEIRFDKEQALLVCTFDSNNICERVEIHADNGVIMKQFVDYLVRNYYYNHLGGRWEVAGSFLRIRETDDMKNRVYLVLT